MTTRVAVMAVAVAFAAVTGGLSAQQREKIDVSKLGPQVGDRVPDFSLIDQAGRTQTVHSIMGARGAMLVFVRSADWCPFCRTQLVELQGRVDALRQRGIGVAVISYDSGQILADFARRHGITYPMLSDVGSATIRRYGILNTVVEEALGPNGKDPAVIADFQRLVSVGQPLDRYKGIAYPGTFMLDRQGRVTARFFEDYYWERNTVSNLMLRVGAGRVPVQAVQVSTQHLDVRTYPSDASVSLGTRFGLALDITPKRNMHVYAPGASGYQVVTLTIAPQQHLQLQPPKYPASELYHFVPLNERVPAYTKPFTIAVDVVVEATATARQALRDATELTVNATLEYQACDDRVCYNPQSLPLSWRIALSPNVPGAPAAPR